MADATPASFSPAKTLETEGNDMGFIDETRSRLAHEWLPRISAEITELHHFRRIWTDLSDALDAQGDPERWYFRNVFTRMYVDAQTSCLRRQIDLDSRSVSLARLMTTLRDHPKIMTREHWLGLWTVPGEGWKKQANETFDRFAGGSGDQLSPEVIDDHLIELNDTNSKIRELVNKRVAHSSKREPLGITLEDLDQAINSAGTMLTEYTLILTATSYGKIEPTMQGDWLSPFRRPLL